MRRAAITDSCSRRAESLPPVVPSISINDVSGWKAETARRLHVHRQLSQATSGPVLVNFATANGSAIAGTDYASTAGTLVFNPGETKTITVAVNGDRTREADETFRVFLSNPDGATIYDGTGAGVIRNDDK